MKNYNDTLKKIMKVRNINNKQTQPIPKMPTDTGLVYYEPYIPNAFDESLTIIEKVNKVIFQLNTLNAISNELVSQWEEFLEWFYGGGLNELIHEELMKLIEDGTIGDLINDELLAGINEEIDELEEDILELEEKVDSNYSTLNNKIDNITSNMGSPSGAFQTYDELVATYPDGNDNIYVVVEDGNWYYFDDVSGVWTPGGVYQTPISPDNYAVLVPTKNLFNKNSIQSGFYVDWGSGILQPNPTFFASNPIPIKTSTNYIKNSTQQIAFYDTNNNYISGIASTPSYFMSPSNASFIIVCDNLNVLETFQLEEGTERTAYVEYDLKINPDDIAEASIEDSHLKEDYPILQPSKNLFDVNTITPGYYVQYSTGVLLVNENFFTSDFIEVVEGETYIKNGSQQLAFYDASKHYISGIATTNDSFIIPNGVRLMRFCDLNDKLPNMQLEKGDTVTDYVSCTNGINPTNISDKTIDDNHLKNKYAKTVHSVNLFLIETVTEGKSVSWSDGILVENPNFFTSDYIRVYPNLNYIKNDTQQLAFYDDQRNYISGIASTPSYFTAPAEAYWVRFCASNNLLNFMQFEEGTQSTNYIRGGYYIPQNSIMYSESLGNQHEINMKIQIPRNIYLVTGEQYSIYWWNVISNANMMGDSYYVRVQKVVNGVYSVIGEDYNYKWSFTPAIEEIFDLEIRLVNSITNAIVDMKIVRVNIANKNQTGKTGTIVTLGDSFTDGYKVSKFVHDFVSESCILNSIGLHDTGKTGVYDDAWSGESFFWYNNTPTAYLRNDRPLEDAVWDTGWGMNEPNGWLPGDTYADLTPEQRSHGHTRNQFYDAVTGHFNFQFYINQSFPQYVPSSQVGNHIHSVIVLLGLNDSIWIPTEDLKASLENAFENITNIFDSIHSWDSNIKIGVGLVTPQQQNDTYINSYGYNFQHSKRSKINQEIWNDFMLTNFDTVELENRNVHIIPTSCHFDTRYGLLMKNITPVKFDETIIESVTSDVHPTDNGSQHIADSVRNFILNKVVISQ